MMFIESYSAKETYAIGRKLGKEAQKGDILALNGELGVGKTIFAKGVADGLGIEEHVASPTFTILQIYGSGRLPFYHFDVYRITDIAEMDEIGYEEYFYGDGVTLIEWSDIVQDLLPLNIKQITISKIPNKGDDYRLIIIK